MFWQAWSKILPVSSSPWVVVPPVTFYASRGWYGIWYTCNDWLATGL
ncbi:MAG: DUF2459 domain-containing protein, partial [Synechococcales cyanobacterium RU_4_20]|nr:DUF2459 domain-containing protein [Synechococcales cyanobacterium RU_4_20]